MPMYDYHCEANDRVVEVLHAISEEITTWGALCRAAEINLGDTPEDAPVAKLVRAPRLNFPKTNAELKNMGFTKLVRRDKGVYENVTATEGESRIVNPDDPKTMPNFKKKIAD